MNRWRVAVVTVVVLGLGGALIWTQIRGDDQRPATTNEPTSSPQTSPTPTEEPVVRPDLTGEDFTTIVVDILGFLDRLSEAPDPSLVDAVYAPRCPCYEERRKSLAELKKRGYRYIEPHTEVLSVERQEAVGSQDRAVLEVVAREGATVVVDTQGDVIDEFEAKPPTRFTFVLVRGGATEPWRVTALVRLGVEGGE
jgi:hypothetical protein